jgi:hypothetical protein
LPLVVVGNVFEPGTFLGMRTSFTDLCKMSTAEFALGLRRVEVLMSRVTAYNFQRDSQKDLDQLVRLVIRLRLRVERRADRFFIPWHKLVHLPADNEHSSSRTKKTPLAGVREDSNGGGR